MSIVVGELSQARHKYFVSLCIGKESLCLGRFNDQKISEKILARGYFVRTNWGTRSNPHYVSISQPDICSVENILEIVTGSKFIDILSHRFVRNANDADINKHPIFCDRRGYYTHDIFWHARKRPIRHRFHSSMNGVISEFIQHGHITAKHRLIRKCSVCGVEVYGKNRWYWSFVAGLANSDYISGCKACGKTSKPTSLHAEITGQGLHVVSYIDPPALFPLVVSDPEQAVAECSAINTGGAA